MLQLLRYLDWGERVENITQRWPSFSGDLIRRFNRDYLHQERQKKRSRARYELARSRVYRVPETQLLLWEQEIFEIVFHHVLTGLSEHLLHEGTWEPGIEYWLLSRVLPNMLLHVGHWNSRVIRPPLPLPSTLAEAIDPVSAIDHEEEFNSWYRCAYYEKELVLADRVSPEVVEEVTGTSGIVFSLETQASLKEHLPFGIGRVEVWLDTLLSTDEVRLSPFSGPLVGFTCSRRLSRAKANFHAAPCYRCEMRFAADTTAWSAYTHRW